MINGVKQYFTVADITERPRADAIAAYIECANPPVDVHLDPALLEFSDTERLQVLDFIVSLMGGRFFGPDGIASDILAVATAIVHFDSKDVARSERGRQLLIEIAALAHPGAIPTAAQVVRQKLATAGYKYVKIPALERDIRRLRDMLKQSAKSAAESDLPLVRAILPDAPVGDDAVVPHGWALTLDGIWRNDRLVCYSPIVITELGHDQRRNRETVGLAWWTHDGWRSLTTGRHDVADTSRLIALATSGFPGNATNAKELVAYLAEYEAANKTRIPYVDVSNRLGWHRDRTGFLWGIYYITANGRYGTDDATMDRVRFQGLAAGDEQIARAFRAEGEFPAWIDGVCAAAKNPVPAFWLYAAFVSAAAPLFGVHNFVLSLAGPTTVGKTSTLQLCASVWGCPKDHDPATLINNWNSTPVFRDRMAAICGHLPVFLDETQHARQPENVGKFIYGFAQGRARGARQRVGD